MTRPRRIVICLIAAAVVGIGFAGVGVQRLQAQAAAKKAEKTAVAVVNVAFLINKCDKKTGFDEEIQKRAAAYERDQQKKQERINTMRLDYEVIANPQKRAEKEREIIQAIAEFRAWQQIQQEYIARDQRLNLIELYGDIDRTVATVAQREGYDLVLFSTPTPDFEKLNPEQLLQVIGNRRVIYQTDKIDITSVVLEQLNLDLLNGKAN